MAANASTASAGGRLTVFLGYAAGVGKTYMMLEEAQRRRKAGADLVIGYFEPHGRKDTIALTAGLETVPTRSIEYRGARLAEMDTDAILARRPAVCVVDELAHTNVPGAERAKRWEDVEQFQAAGIDVLTTLNVQHLESLNDQIWQLSGVRVRETVPDWFVQQAHEVVMVDVTPRALVHRLERGVIYPPEQARQALNNFFKESTLAALREMTLRQAAHVVEIHQTPTAEAPAAAAIAASVAGVAAVGAERESLLVVVTPHPASAIVVRRGKRVADFLHAGCVAVHVQGKGALPAEAAAAVEKHLRFARDLHLDTQRLQGADEAETLVEYARQRRITQIFMAREATRHGLVLRVVRLARDMQVIVVAERGPAGAHG